MKEMNRKEFLKLAVKGTAAAAVLSALPSTLTAYADEGEKLYIPGTYSAEAPGKEKVIVTMTFDETKGCTGGCICRDPGNRRHPR